MTAERKTDSVFSKALVDAVTETLVDRDPALKIPTIVLKDLLQETNQTFEDSKNRNMEEVSFFSG